MLFSIFFQKVKSPSEKFANFHNLTCLSAGWKQGLRLNNSFVFIVDPEQAGFCEKTPVCRQHQQLTQWLPQPWMGKRPGETLSICAMVLSWERKAQGSQTPNE